MPCPKVDKICDAQTTTNAYVDGNGGSVDILDFSKFLISVKNTGSNSIYYKILGRADPRDADSPWHEILGETELTVATLTAVHTSTDAYGEVKIQITAKVDGSQSTVDAFLVAKEK